MEPLFNKKNAYIKRVYNDLLDYLGANNVMPLDKIASNINKKYETFLNKYDGVVEASRDIDVFLKKAMTDYLLQCFQEDLYGLQSDEKEDKEKRFDRVYTLLTIANGVGSISFNDPKIKKIILKYAEITDIEYDEIVNKNFPSHENIEESVIETYEKIGSITK